MTHVRTSPFYPQSSGKIERWHQSLKGECLRPGVPLSIEDAGRLVSRYVIHYNRARLHGAIGYMASLAKLEGHESKIFTERDRKLQAARRQHQLRSTPNQNRKALRHGNCGASCCHPRQVERPAR